MIDKRRVQVFSSVIFEAKKEKEKVFSSVINN